MARKLKPISEQTIVITGASSGIGLTTAQRAARAGANVVLVSRNEMALKKIRDEIRSAGGKADFVAADMGVRDEVRNVVDTVVERHGGFDTWVNGAGVGIYARLEETSDEDHQKIFQTNYWGVVYGSLEALKHLKYKHGALINIGSISSDMPAPILSAYTASKHAVKGFTDSLRLELLHDKAPVSVTLIKPSGIQTPFGDHAKNYMDAASRVPPPVYHPEVVAEAILRAATHPMRDITVGGAGLAMTMLAGIAPALSDRLFAWSFFKTARDEKQKKHDESALHEPGDGGRKLGEQSGHIRETSLAAKAQMHPFATAGLTAIAAVAVLSLRKSGRQRLGNATRAAIPTRLLIGSITP
ncbi:short-chain dehydrogenase/reductase SDR [Parvibaculum lavamentivorans DS-1]|uniref:Short-chain dehydrogenase/reductase SDR n=2 Tax=Parvibaculum lavamentivorans TaxID=256618 RepID=A7HYX3_PARL1|nr:short-chain dehydrogenase/reductase SDR [Parvibaculum lavamentivorans DS-1]